MKEIKLKDIEDGLKFIEKQYKEGIVDKKLYEAKKDAIYKVKKIAIEWKIIKEG